MDHSTFIKMVYYFNKGPNFTVRSTFYSISQQNGRYRHTASPVCRDHDFVCAFFCISHSFIQGHLRVVARERRVQNNVKIVYEISRQLEP